MEISLDTVQELSPDQASLTAAKKLTNPEKWPVLGRASSTHTIWGTCQGSGSTLYDTVADVSDQSYKCSCSSRKSPCKHVLALLWQFSESSENVAEADTPQWVTEWLNHRRSPSSSSTTKQNKTQQNKAAPKKTSAQTTKAAQNKKKADDKVSQALTEYHQWLDDQLVNGISIFIKEIEQRCRQIASRLVDAKANSFAARINALPEKISSLEAEQQIELVYQELGKLSILSEAWFIDPDNMDVRQSIIGIGTQKQVSSHPESLRVTGVWETIGERIETNKRGFITHSKWLLNLTDQNCQPALLLDVFHKSSYKTITSTLGQKIEGDVIYCPAKIPMRAILDEYEVLEQQSNQYTRMVMDYEAQRQQQLITYPWLEIFPVMLGKGKILKDRQGVHWWISDQEKLTIKLQNKAINPAALFVELEYAFMVSNGETADLLTVYEKDWGILAC